MTTPGSRNGRSDTELPIRGEPVPSIPAAAIARITALATQLGVACPPARLPSVTVSELVALLAVWFAAIASPGPDLLQIIRLGSKSRAAGVWGALGIMTGNTLWISGSLLGLSALINAYPGVLTVLQLLGGSYLLWMGVGAVRGGLAARRQAAVPVTVPRDAAPPDDAPRDAAPPPAHAGGAWRLGLTTNLANPKAILFFGAVFAQFVRPEMGVGWAGAIAVLMIVTGVAFFVGFALTVHLLAAKLVRNAAAIDLVSGVIFVALALFMLYEGVLGVGEWMNGPPSAAAPR